MTIKIKKPMTYAKAKRVLTKMANGEYHATEYAETNYGLDINGVKRPYQDQECKVYMSGTDKGLGWFRGDTWDIALEKLADAIKTVQDNKAEE